MEKIVNWTGRSSQIKTTYYDKEKKAMSVLFENPKTKATSLWQYTPVSVELWLESTKADSIGKFVNRKIKPNCTAFKMS